MASKNSPVFKTVVSIQEIDRGLVSTIIPVFNRPNLVREAVESVLAQSYRPIEIIVIDDGSTDNTLEVLKGLAEQNAEVKILSQTNSGPGVARELGRKKAQGEFIQYLDSDDLLLPEKFTLQVKALLNYPDCDVAYGKTELTEIGEELKGQALKRTGEKITSMFPLFLCERWWSTSTPLHRSNVLQKAGAWLPLLNEEDWEYDCRVASLGGNLVYVDEFVSNTRRHNDHLSSEGAINKVKLADRCRAQQSIYTHAMSYMELDSRPSEITQQDWLLYSKSVFLLARQCAMLGLVEQAKSMYRLSIRANGSSTIKHKLFYFLASIIGWRQTSKLMQRLGK